MLSSVFSMSARNWNSSLVGSDIDTVDRLPEPATVVSLLRRDDRQRTPRSAAAPLPSGRGVRSEKDPIVKDAPLLRGNLAVRLVALFGGLLLFGLAIVFMLV